MQISLSTQKVICLFLFIVFQLLLNAKSIFYESRFDESQVCFEEKSEFQFSDSFLACPGGTAPTFLAFAMQPSCSDNISNSDGYLQLSSVTDGDRVAFSSGGTFTGDTDYANATTIGTLPFLFAMGQSNPSGSQDYTIRVFNGASNCFTDVVVTMNEQDCTLGCDCIENIYLNETSNNGKIHRYTIDIADTTFTEILIGGNAWYPGSGTSQLPTPHGIAIDLNGNVYAGEDYYNSHIRRLNCNGEIAPESEFLLDDIRGLTNIGTLRGDIVYTNMGTAWDICTMSALPRVTLCNPASENWGFYIDQSTGAFYSTTNSSGPNHIYKYTEADYGSGMCVPIFINQSVLYANVPGTNQGNTRARGIVTDRFGNIYVAYFTNTVSGGTSNEGLIVKYDSNGNYVSHQLDTQDDGMGWAVSSALVYSEATGILYSATQSAIEPCVFAFSTEPTFAPIGPMVDPSGDTELQGSGDFTYAKGMGLIEQCCPTNNNMTVDTTVCGVQINDQLFLQNLISCGGTICEGMWQEGASNIGMTYNPCDNSVTIDALNACGTFTIESDGTGDSPQCGAFIITVNIEVEDIADNSISIGQTVCQGNAANTLTSNATSTNGTLTYQWQSSTTDCLSGFSDIAGETASTYEPGVVSQTTYYQLITSVNGNCSSGMCSDTSNCVTITLSPTPTCSITGNTELLINAQDEPYSGAAGANNYQWSITAGDATIDGAANAQNVVVDYGVDTSTLQLIVTNTDGCRDTCDLTIYPLSFDLALTKVLVSTGPFQGGDDVTFRVTVYNQGNIDATNIMVNDYIPNGLVLNDPAWNEIMPQVAQRSIASLAGGASTTLDITLRINSSFSGMLINNAEIVAADGGIDEDDPLSNTNDGSTNELATDNNVNDDDPNTPGTGDLPSDEDDYDPALIQVECPEPVCLPVQTNQN